MASVSADEMIKPRGGRAARRRRRKFKAIQQSQEERAQQQDEVLPVDRSAILPAVLELRKNWNKKDEHALIQQLGYLPGNAIRVPTRARNVPMLLLEDDDDDAPVVVQLYPMVLRNEHSGGKGSRKFKSRKRRRLESNSAEDDTATSTTAPDNNRVLEPFPTIYWLTHPKLHRLISQLELEGLGVQLEKKLECDTDAKTRVIQANVGYGQERWDLLTETDAALIRERQWNAAFTRRGVAGNGNPLAVKCLHAHVAHYLSDGKGSTDNVIGEWVMEELHKRQETKATNEASNETAESDE